MPKWSFRFTWTMLFLVVLIILPALIPARVVVLAASTTLRPAADAYVSSTYPGTNYGKSTSLRADGSPVMRAYLLFNLSGVTGTITQAKLRIYASSASTSGIRVHPVVTSWSETGINYNNAPTPGSVFVTTSAVNANSWKEVDITGLISGSGQLNIALTTTGSTAINLSSKEAGLNSPQLVLTTSQPTASSTPTRIATQPPPPTQTPTSPPDLQPTLPIRAAFYYPWFPEAWMQNGTYPFTNYTPSQGYYATTDTAVIRQHLAAMQYGNFQAGIISWQGPNQYTDDRVPVILDATSGSAFRWLLYYSNENTGDPSVGQIQADLTYIRDQYGNDPAYLRINGRFVVFVSADANDGCGMADRWKQANTVNAYIVLKVFSNYPTCPSQPDSWHQYAPAVAADQQGEMSFTISPGFWPKGSAEGLRRDLNRWAGNVRDMVTSRANWQLVTTFNEWGQGTAVEMAQEWTSASGYGSFLDVLHENGQQPPSGPITFNPVADAFVDSSNPNINYGGASLRVDGSPIIRSYMRYNLSGIDGMILQAKLRVYANSASTNTISVWGVGDNTWSESAITAANAPAIGSTVSTTGPVSAGRWQEWDVTSLVTGNGLVSMGLSTTGGTAISLASRESGANAPQLVITTSQAGPLPVVLLAAGDIAKCAGSTPGPTNGAMITSDMILDTGNTIFTLGDNSNDAGAAADYANCYDPTWGRVKDRTYPVMGNHDIIADPQGTPYFNYFGAVSHPDTFGHYSLNLGAWHIIVLNAECGVGNQGCGTGSLQEQWLRADLAENTQKCVMALWHQPLFTSGTQSPTPGMEAFWQALYDYRADIILNGHNHNYERFAPQDPNGNPTSDGLREFIVGTGGASLDPSPLPMAANQEVRSAAAYGYLKLTLNADRYDWQFISQSGNSFTDTGSAVCH